VPIQIPARSLLLVSSGTVRKCEKESMMAKFRKRMMKWGLMAAKVGLTASIIVAPAVSAQASEFDGFDGLDFGALVQRGLERSSNIWFGVGGPLKESAPPTSIENYRTQTQRASDQVLLAEGLKAEYVTRNAGNGADMFAFWPNDESPTHLIFCIENSRQDLGTFLPGGLIKKFNPAVQRIKLSDGSVETILRGTIACDGIRRTPWQTILATEEASDGGAYEIVNPLNVTNQTITDRTLGTIIDENGLPSTSIVKRTALPKMAWEGIGITPEGVVYAGDELRPGTPANADGGAMFKFIPAIPRTVSGPIESLSESPFTAGNVYALQVSCQNNTQQFGQGCEIGNGAWISVSAANARTDANSAGATGYYRPEDLERDPDFAGPGARFCWTDTGLEEGGNYGEVLCAVDSAPLVADPAQRTVVVNRFVEGNPDMNQPDNFAFQPKTGNHYVIEDHPNGDIFACLPDGADRDIKTDGCVKILSVKDTSAEPTGFKFTADGRTAYLSIQHSHDGQMPKFDDYVTDDIVKITGFKIPFRFQR
jgi:hypothetical protein